MTRYLVATATPGTTEAACDYLEQKLEDGDEVFVLTVEEPDGADDDRSEALRAAQVRLAEDVSVRTIRREGVPDQQIVSFARDRDVDEIIVGPTRQGSGIGSTTKAILNKVEVPVFVVSL